MGYFNIDELFILDSVKIDTEITGVNYYKWHNLAASKNGYVFIDKIELQFNNIPSILFEINENDEGISLKTNYNVGIEIADIEAKFNTQIKIIKTSEKLSDLWGSILNLPLLSIEAEQQEQFYLNNALLLNFGEEKRIIFFDNEKGLLAEYYTEN
jgi:hypothetical protein